APHDRRGRRRPRALALRLGDRPPGLTAPHIPFGTGVAADACHRDPRWRYEHQPRLARSILDRGPGTSHSPPWGTQPSPISLKCPPASAATRAPNHSNPSAGNSTITAADLTNRTPYQQAVAAAVPAPLDRRRHRTIFTCHTGGTAARRRPGW